MVKTEDRYFGRVYHARPKAGMSEGPRNEKNRGRREIAVHRWKDGDEKGVGFERKAEKLAEGGSGYKRRFFRAFLSSIRASAHVLFCPFFPPL